MANKQCQTQFFLDLAAILKFALWPQSWIFQLTRIMEHINTHRSLLRDALWETATGSCHNDE